MLGQDPGFPHERIPWPAASRAEGARTPAAPPAAAGTAFGRAAAFALKIPTLKCKKRRLRRGRCSGEFRAKPKYLCRNFVFSLRFWVSRCLFPLLLPGPGTNKGSPQPSRAERDISHRLTTKPAEIQQTTPQLPPPAQFLFFSALSFAKSLKFPTALVAQCVKGKLAALRAIVNPPYETPGFRLRFLPAALIEVSHALGISLCHRGGCTVQNAGVALALMPLAPAGDHPQRVGFYRR